MGTKIQPGKFDCHAAAMPDEPMFVLLGRDPSAPAMLRAWVDQRRKDIVRGERDESDLRKCTEAEDCANEMEKWRHLNEGAWRAGADARKALDAAPEDEMQLLGQAVREAFAKRLRISDGFIEIAHHSERPFANADFALRRHRLHIKTKGAFSEFHGEIIAPSEISARGLIIGDCEIIVLDDDELMITVVAAYD